ncbi:vasodilator-stimulated phosphoprotein-like [Sycon ciliatum]|uniref:vasodilator-stimulated phosphoprotein-like n=1 Tax=Sycon ciliatum TaxID=27933 RepID=UPI0031F663C6
MSERQTAQAQATVLVYDDKVKKWTPAQQQNTPSAVQLFVNDSTAQSRIVGRRMSDMQVTVNTQLYKGMVFNAASKTFYQWRDPRNVYGLNFQDPQVAATFASAVGDALKQLTGGGGQQQQQQQPPPPARSQPPAQPARQQAAPAAAPQPPPQQPQRAPAPPAAPPVPAAAPTPPPAPAGPPAPPAPGPGGPPAPPPQGPPVPPPGGGGGGGGGGGPPPPPGPPPPMASNGPPGPPPPPSLSGSGGGGGGRGGGSGSGLAGALGAVKLKKSDTPVSPLGKKETITNSCSCNYPLSKMCA